MVIFYLYIIKNEIMVSDFSICEKLQTQYGKESTAECAANDVAHVVM